MEPAIREDDWLLVDPTSTRWPRRGTIVAFHELDSGALSIKRVAGRPGDRIPFRDGYLELGRRRGMADRRRRSRHDGRRRARRTDRLAVVRSGAGRPARGSRVVPVRATAPDRSA